MLILQLIPSVETTSLNIFHLLTFIKPDNTKSRHVWKKTAIWICIGLLIDQLSLKNCIFLLILRVVFIVPSHCFFPKLQLHVTKKF